MRGAGNNGVWAGRDVPGHPEEIMFEEEPPLFSILVDGKMSAQQSTEYMKRSMLPWGKWPKSFFWGGR